MSVHLFNVCSFVYRMEDVDHASPDSPSLVKQRSLPLVGGGGGKGGGERQKQLMEKNSQLEARVSELEKVHDIYT